MCNGWLWAYQDDHIYLQHDKIIGEVYDVSFNGKVILGTNNLQAYVDIISRKRDRNNDNVQYRRYLRETENSNESRYSISGGDR